MPVQGPVVAGQPDQAGCDFIVQSFRFGDHSAGEIVHSKVHGIPGLHETYQRGYDDQNKCQGKMRRRRNGSAGQSAREAMSAGLRGGLR